ncbi:MAG TPA: PDZ domain-containing protein [Candidatus Angelobacter sp.]|nr:PDZ domain-containing protein [Candidatus Angelobacter sp.]
MSRKPSWRTSLPQACCLVFLLSLFGSPGRAQTESTIRYEVSLKNPERHFFHVSVKLPVKGEALLQMPAWNALYQIRDFSTRIQEVQAHIGTSPAAIEKMDKQTWRVKGDGVVQIEYAIYWDDSGPFATQLNGDHAFINPAMILMYVAGHTGDETLLSVSDFPNDWRLASATPFRCEPVSGRTSCSADKSSYDRIADGPIEMGKFEEFDLPGVSPRITAVIHGDNWRKKQVEEELKRICQYELKMMDDAPFEHYTFILHIGKGVGGGGMEHSYSTAISVYSDEYLANVAAHEFFHLWNVKRIRPASLEPVDYTKEQYTRALWFAEGVTNTYGSYTLVRSGIWNKERFYDDLGQQITELEARPANRWQSVEQSSLDAWLEKYPLYNQPDYSVSYYTKGQVLGDLLDILIRDRTDNGKSLDDVLRAMNAEFAKQGKTYRDSLDVRLTVEKVAGGSFEEFFQKYVSGTEPFPYQQVLALAGLQLRTMEQWRATLGFTLSRDSGGAIVVGSVEGDSNAAQAGLRFGDVIVSWNGGEVPRRPQRWVTEQNPGDLLRLRMRHEEKESNIEFRLGEIKETIYQVGEDSHATEKARHIREGLLRGTTAPAGH